MTAKDKAKELVDKFMPFTDVAGDAATSYEAEQINKKYAKKAALLCCDEVIEDSVGSMNDLPQFKHMYVATKIIYEEVRGEIKKL